MLTAFQHAVNLLAIDLKIMIANHIQNYMSTYVFKHAKFRSNSSQSI
uniref:Uncharacterized protein n=1 Tax=Anguilla anguilla TaxID=7936 RepID=A0A0E9W997_ANGAN